MKRSTALMLVLALVMPAAGLVAQAKPNFAGKWTLVPDPNALPGGQGRGGLGQSITIEQTDKTVTVIATTQMGETKAVYNLDGSETKNPLTFQDNTIDRVSTVKWDGEKLVLNTKYTFDGNTFESVQTWSLDSPGNLIVESTSNISMTGETWSTKVTYKKGA